MSGIILYKIDFNILIIIDFIILFSAASEQEIHVNQAVDERTKLNICLATNLMGPHGMLELHNNVSQYLYILTIYVSIAKHTVLSVK